MIADFIKRRALPVRPMVRRETYTLTPEEWQRFEAERNSRWPREGFAYRFWQEVAAARDLDYATIIGDPAKPWTFTALPCGHGRHWCWPMQLTCAKAPPVGLEHIPSIW